MAKPITVVTKGAIQSLEATAECVLENTWSRGLCVRVSCELKETKILATSDPDLLKELPRVDLPRLHFGRLAQHFGDGLTRAEWNRLREACDAAWEEFEKYAHEHAVTYVQGDRVGTLATRR